MHKLERKNGQKRQRALRLLGKYWPYYLMMLPGLIYFALLKYAPMYGVLIAFKDFKIKKGIWGSPWVGLQNFRTFFTSTYCSRLIGNTLIISFTKLVLSSFMSVFFALLLNECGKRRFKRLVQTVSYMPHFVSTVVLVSMINNICSPSIGVLAKIWKSMGLTPVNWLAVPDYFYGINIVSGLWQCIGWNAVIYISAIAGIDQSLYEAARMDGANRWKQILHVTIPGILPTFILLLIMQIGQLMNCVFDKIWLLQNTLNMQVSEMLPTYVYRLGMVSQKYGQATAGGLLNSVISVTLVLIANFVSRKVSETSLF